MRSSSQRVRSGCGALHVNAPVPVVEDVSDDDGEEAEQERGSAGVDHGMEHSHRDRARVGEIRHFLRRKE